jgi:ribosome assembly protein 1
VINKMDRLITELQLQPQEAYHHLTRLVEQVNSIIGSFYQSERMENEYGRQAPPDKHVDADEVAAKLQEADTSNPNKDDEEEDIYFSPERGNVVFASAIDGWAFRTKDFARIFAVKFGFNPAVLERFLWGDFYWDAKARRVIGPKLLKGRNFRPLFVQIALENIWAVYNNVLIQL